MLRRAPGTVRRRTAPPWCGACGGLGCGAGMSDGRPYGLRARLAAARRAEAEAVARYQARRRAAAAILAERRAAGQCVRCGAEAGGAARCSMCEDTGRALRAAWRAAGKCVQCGRLADRNESEGWGRCWYCGERRDGRRRAWRARLMQFTSEKWVSDLVGGRNSLASILLARSGRVSAGVFEQAAYLVAAGCWPGEVAARCGVCSATLRRWRRYPGFQRLIEAEIEERRAQSMTARYGSAVPVWCQQCGALYEGWAGLPCARCEGRSLPYNRGGARWAAESRRKAWAQIRGGRLNG